MPQIGLTEGTLKWVFKEALREALQEQREPLHEILLVALEDFALAAAIREGRETKSATHEEVFRILQSKPRGRPSARVSPET